MKEERQIFFFFKVFPSLLFLGYLNSSKDTGYLMRLGAFMKLTFITCITSRGPIISGSYLMCALLVARATEQYKTPLVFMRVDSILCIQEAHVIPLTCKIKVPSCYQNHRLLGKCILKSRKRKSAYDYPELLIACFWGLKQ